MKYIVYAMAAMFFLASCSKDNDETGGVTAVEEKPEE